MKYTVYVLLDKYNRLYIGSTNNFERRIKEHLSGQTKSTRNRGPFKILLIENFKTRMEAYKREFFLKTGQGRILIKKLIKNMGV